MASLELTKPTGRTSGSVDVDDALFGVEPNIPVMHQVVTAQLAARRAGTQSTKTRAEVRGGGAKPWRQKGTGRSRQGSIRAPQWRGGGVALGPKPRSYAQRTPRKMIRLALASALSDRMADGKVKVLDDWGIEEPSTKRAVEVLGSIGVDRRERRGERFRMTDPRDIIVAPVVSEKSYALMEGGVYTFTVHPDASKPQIRDAVQEIFGVKVAKVNTMNRPGKRKRNRRTFTYGRRPDTKRSLAHRKPPPGGRNAPARKPARPRGGGQKQRYRFYHFRRNKDGVPAK